MHCTSSRKGVQAERVVYNVLLGATPVHAASDTHDYNYDTDDEGHEGDHEQHGHPPLCPPASPARQVAYDM